MTVEEARQLMVGDNVTWPASAEARACEGEVIETGYAAFKVRWEDGIVTIFQFSQPIPVERSQPT